MLEVDENDWPNELEFERLRPFEDRLVEAVERDGQSILSVVLTCNGEKQFVFHTGDEAILGVFNLTEGANTLRLIFLHGLPGVGKLTVAGELARLTGYKLLHNHLAVDLVESVFDFGSGPFVELREMIWLAMFSHAVEEQLAGLIFTFAHDRTVRSSFIVATRNVVESGGGRVSFVELRCSVEELERRIEQPSRREFGKLNSVTRFRELKEAGAFVDPSIPAVGLVVETDGKSAAEAAEEIFSRLGLDPPGLDSAA